jgi:hypothetical protein
MVCRSFLWSVSKFLRLLSTDETASCLVRTRVVEDKNPLRYSNDGRALDNKYTRATQRHTSHFRSVSSTTCHHHPSATAGYSGRHELCLFAAKLQSLIQQLDRKGAMKNGTLAEVLWIENAGTNIKLPCVSIILIHQGPRTLGMYLVCVCERHQSRPRCGRDDLEIIPCMPLTTQLNRPLVFQDPKSLCKMFASWIQTTGGFHPQQQQNGLHSLRCFMAGRYSSNIAFGGLTCRRKNAYLSS